MCFSNKVQVKYNLLENLDLKISERETKAGLCKRFFNYSIFFSLKQGRFIKNKNMYIQYKTLGLGAHSCLYSNTKYRFKEPGFVQLTVDVVDFNKTKIKIEQVYINTTRYIVSFSFYIIIA